MGKFNNFNRRGEYFSFSFLLLYLRRRRRKSKRKLTEKFNNFSLKNEKNWARIFLLFFFLKVNE